MASEIPYRLAIVVIFGTTLPIAAYHRWKAASSEKISHADEGYLFAAVLRLAGLALGVSTVLYMVNPHVLRPAYVPLPDVARWFGLPLGLLSAALLGWTLTSLGKNLTDTVVTRANATLVTHGPYRWVRHPFYVSTGLLILSVALLSTSLLIVGSGLLVLLLLAARTPKEEQRLTDRFGDDYRLYMASTGRYLPRLPR